MFNCFPVNVAAYAGLIPVRLCTSHRAAPRPAPRHHALDIPQCNIDGGYRRIDHRTLEVPESMHYVPGMLILKLACWRGILRNAVTAVAPGPDLAPGSRFAPANHAILGLCAHQTKLDYVKQRDRTDDRGGYHITEKRRTTDQC
jgi:hypothetical protein